MFNTSDFHTGKNDGEEQLTVINAAVFFFKKGFGSTYFNHPRVFLIFSSTLFTRKLRTAHNRSGISPQSVF